MYQLDKKQDFETMNTRTFFNSCFSP
uniref:Uncharacterized protein n=1 Tax=Anguilla anguilla TaxID=7936 RepID=A0A0E9QTZ1_ANGAN